MFNGGGNIAGMMKKVQKMQTEMKKMQDELKRKTIEVSAGGGADERLHQCFHNLIAAQLDVKDGLAAINAFERYL
ncbi:MAG: YbaB/EbfC family nucleoid-associated protein [Prevotella sp.]